MNVVESERTSASTKHTTFESFNKNTRRPSSFKQFMIPRICFTSDRRLGDCRRIVDDKRFIQDNKSANIIIKLEQYQLHILLLIKSCIFRLKCASVNNSPTRMSIICRIFSSTSTDNRHNASHTAGRIHGRSTFVQCSDSIAHIVAIDVRTYKQ
jgi:hypothetical protein